MSQRYVWKGDGFYCKRTGAPMEKPYPGAVGKSIMVVSDIPDYYSPIDGRLISGRAQRREDLKRNGCVEKDPPKKPRGFKNPRFCKKHGFELAPEFGGNEPSYTGKTK